MLFYKVVVGTEFRHNGTVYRKHDNRNAMSQYGQMVRFADSAMVNVTATHDRKAVTSG